MSSVASCEFCSPLISTSPLHEEISSHVSTRYFCEGISVIRMRAFDFGAMAHATLAYDFGQNYF